ncbi:MAG: hypothetical protein CO090_07130 [Acidobacteria bacterium CG_4_9_14_3_um_filter_49_7]|nr:MAG: hypothetical protein CO090_07130 [Acidobacteria bacterium CG_4_9_14_3_um_filter_49_7]
MNTIDRAIMNALTVNLGYRENEKVGVVFQEWSTAVGEDYRKKFMESEELCQRMIFVFHSNDVPAVLLPYVPVEARNGADAVPELYEMAKGLDVLFMPVVFSLTHTPFRKAMTSHGARIASMPGFTLEMFEQGGPMDTDYEKLAVDTHKIQQKLAASRFVQVTAPGTDMRIEIVPETAHASTGMLDKPGAFGNLPGAEAYALPLEGGTSGGYFTVPTGWGGQIPLPFPVKFTVVNNRFVNIEGADTEQQAWIDQHIKPLIMEQENFNVLAELGIGTNPNLNEEYISKHGWGILTAEKISGSAHFANGNNAGFGGKNNVPVHIDWVVPGVKISYQE